MSFIKIKPRNRRPVISQYDSAVALERPQPALKLTSTAIILLVDDDPGVRESLSQVVTIEGWQVVCAASGEEAFEYLSEHQPDLIITDLCLVSISGWDLLFHEKIQRPELPIFVITGLPSSETKGADHIATAFFPKPVDLEELVLAILRSLGIAPTAPMNN